MAKRQAEEIDRYTFNSTKYGVKVTLHDARFRCTKCGLWKPASQFGMLSDVNNVIRNQPQCKDCRSL